MSTPSESPTTVRTLVAGSAVIVTAFIVSAVALTLPRLPSSEDNLGWLPTIYPWWTWAIVAVGALAGAVGVRASSVRGGRAAAAAAVAFVAGAQLSGMGIVAAKHWKPAFGTGGGYGDVSELQKAAVVVAIAGAVAAGAALWCLTYGGHVVGAASSAGLGSAGTIAGIIMIVVLPVAALVGDDRSHDVTSWGAAGLIYGGPWGLSLILAGRLDRSAAVATAGAVFGSAMLTVLGGRTGELLNYSPTAVFALASLVPLSLVVLWLRHGGTGRDVAQQAVPGREGAR